MHFYSLIVAAICLQKVLSADLYHPLAVCNPLSISSAMAALRAVLMYAAAVLETIVPTVAAMVPDKVPLVIAALTGCSALALRVSHNPSRSVEGEQVSS
jgi:hypothetical protein